MVLLFQPKKQDYWKGFFFWVPLWKTRSQLGDGENRTSTLEGSTEAAMAVGCAMRLGSRDAWDPQWAQRQFADSHITAQRSLTTDTQLTHLPGWPGVKKWCYHNLKLTAPMANQSLHAWVTSTSARFRVLWKYLHSEVLWIIPNNCEYLFC